MLPLSREIDKGNTSQFTELEPCCFINVSQNTYSIMRNKRRCYIAADTISIGGNTWLHLLYRKTPEQPNSVSYDTYQNCN